MGSPVSVTVANLVIEEIEETVLPPTPVCHDISGSDMFITCILWYQPSLWHPCSSIALMNTSSSRSRRRKMVLYHFWTPCWPMSQMAPSQHRWAHTDKYLQFSSHHPLAHNKSVITTLFHWAVALSSNMIKRLEVDRRVARAIPE
jgi:hypothetical protein